MILYHFCCKNDARSIIKHGLSLGTIPYYDRKNNRWVFKSGWQWMTLSKDPEAQSWDTHYLLRFSRTEVRITIEIPDADLDRLYDMDRLKETLPDVNEHLWTDWEGSENWRVFRGVIPKKWIKLVEFVK